MQKVTGTQAMLVNKKPTYQKISKFENTCRFLFIVIELFEENF